MATLQTEPVPARRDLGPSEPDVADPSLENHGPSLGTSAAELLSACAMHPLVLARIEFRLSVRLAMIAAGRRPMRIDPDDRRFAHDAWHNQPVFRRALQTYLAWSSALDDLVAALGTDPRRQERLRFILGHIVAAGAPSNLFLTHPGFYDNLLATRGGSLVAGLRQMLDDWRNNHGLPRQVDSDAFTIGEDLAATAGAVIFRNALFELIQYAPRCTEVDTRPILFVPPQINKFYVLDLAPHNSLVRHALDQGQQVFMMSWRNPTAAQRDWALADYVAAVDKAIEIVGAMAGNASVKLAGACAGGLTAAAALALREKQGRAEGVVCLSLFVTMLTVPRDPEASSRASSDRAIRSALARSSRTGVLDGADMARAFAWLRPNDLVWRFVTNNYVLGQRPPAHDILFWNADTTRLPARLHDDLLKIYSANGTSESAGRMTLGEAEIDLADIGVDVFVVAGDKDHITPWRACHQTTQILNTQSRFVLARAGHVQSVVCPPIDAPGYLSDICGRDESPEAWQARAGLRAGSWWPEWIDWCRAHGDSRVAAPASYGNEQYEPIDAAPGRYVRQQ